MRALLPALEAALQPYGARPHWGKVFTATPVAVAALYPEMPKFRDALSRYDPQGKFRNAFVDEYVFGPALARL